MKLQTHGMHGKHGGIVHLLVGMEGNQDPVHAKKEGFVLEIKLKVDHVVNLVCQLEHGKNGRCGRTVRHRVLVRGGRNEFVVTLRTRSLQLVLGELTVWGSKWNVRSAGWRCATLLYIMMTVVVWSPWGQWGECSKSCGTGTQWRLRSCLEANACSDVSTNGRICNTQSCDDDSDSDDWETTTQLSTVAMTTPAPRWGGWVLVTNCSSPCGPGVVVLQRTCYNATYHLSEDCFGVQATIEDKSEQCEVEECPLWGLWSTWGECKGHCQEAFHTRSRSCATSCCDGPTMDIEECYLAECNFTKPAFNTSAVYTVINTTLCTPGRFLTGDINADNKTDIVCLEDTGYLWSQLGLGNRSFSEVIFSERRVPQCPISFNADVLLADMNGDGADDFVCHYSSHHYFQYLSLTDGKFAEVQTSFSINNYCMTGLDMRILPGKLDGDSKDDFFCQYSNQPALNESVWYIQISN
ncbi:uncharacterized protein LOC108949856 [Ciona intestinalis]